jgi:hypothetical protein
LHSLQDAPGAHLADQAVAGLGEGHHRWRGAAALGVGDDGGLAALHGSHGRVGGAQIDADDLQGAGSQACWSGACPHWWRSELAVAGRRAHWSLGAMLGRTAPLAGPRRTFSQRMFMLMALLAVARARLLALGAATAVPRAACLLPVAFLMAVRILPGCAAIAAAQSQSLCPRGGLLHSFRTVGSMSARGRAQTDWGRLLALRGLVPQSVSLEATGKGRWSGEAQANLYGRGRKRWLALEGTRAPATPQPRSH